MKVAIALLAASLGLSACSSQNKELPMVKDDAPFVRLNADRWQSDTNDLTQPPGDGSPQPFAPPVPWTAGSAL